MKQMINPMFTEKVKPIVKVGEVKPVQIYEKNYVEKRNIKNVELYKEYKKVSELIANGGEVKEEELKSHFTKEAEEIIDHLGSLVNIKFRHTKKRIAIIESKLLQDFTVEQCKLLNLYFFEEWHNNVDMKQHLTIETLYNEKFITRIEISQKAFVDIIKYNETIKKICSFFAITYSKILQNIDISSKIEADGNDILKLVSIKTQRAIAIWAERGISEQDIMDTIYYCILEWSKRKELITKISLTKILDSKFLERLEICTRKKQLAQGLISTNSNKNLEIEKWQYKN